MMNQSSYRLPHSANSHPDSELYLLPIEPIQNLPGSLILKELRERQRRLYLKDQWFQLDFKLPSKLVDYMLCLLDEMTVTVGEDVESIVKHASILLLVSFFQLVHNDKCL